MKAAHGAPEAMQPLDDGKIQYKGEPADIWQCGLILLRMTAEQQAAQASLQDKGIVDSFSNGAIRYKWAASKPGAKVPESYFDAWVEFCRSGPTPRRA